MSLLPLLQLRDKLRTHPYTTHQTGDTGLRVTIVRGAAEKRGDLEDLVLGIVDYLEENAATNRK